MDHTEPITTKDSTRKHNLSLLYGDINLRQAIERELLLAEKDFILNATVDNFKALQSKVLTLKSLYEKSKTDFKDLH